MTEKKDVQGKWGSQQLNFVPVDPKKIKFVNRPKASKSGTKAPAKKR